MNGKGSGHRGPLWNKKVKVAMRVLKLLRRVTSFLSAGRDFPVSVSPSFFFPDPVLCPT